MSHLSSQDQDNLAVAGTLLPGKMYGCVFWGGLPFAGDQTLVADETEAELRRTTLGCILQSWLLTSCSGCPKLTPIIRVVLRDFLIGIVSETKSDVRMPEFSTSCCLTPQIRPHSPSVPARGTVEFIE
jgi:hypothetical protein